MIDITGRMSRTSLYSLLNNHHSALVKSPPGMYQVFPNIAEWIGRDLRRKITVTRRDEQAAGVRN